MKNFKKTISYLLMGATTLAFGLILNGCGGSAPVAEHPEGDHAEHPEGDHAEHPEGDHPEGEHPTGDKAAEGEGEETGHEHPEGEHPEASSEHPSSDDMANNTAEHPAP